MENLAKYKMYIFTSVLLIAGALFALIGNNVETQAGGACLSWGLAIFMLTIINRKKQSSELDSFDINSREILQDIADKGPYSQYYQFYNIDIINKQRKKLLKKHTKQTTTCAIVGIVLVITAMICIF